MQRTILLNCDKPRKGSNASLIDVQQAEKKDAPKKLNVIRNLSSTLLEDTLIVTCNDRPPFKPCDMSTDP
jgi:hypothetical protein